MTSRTLQIVDYRSMFCCIHTITPTREFFLPFAFGLVVDLGMGGYFKVVFPLPRVAALVRPFEAVGRPTVASRQHISIGPPEANLSRSKITRRYATISSGRSLRDKGPPLSLEHFLQRQRALNLWRDVVRAVNSMSEIPASSTRSEMREFARDEFLRNRNVNDIGHIRYLISTGRTQFDGMRRYIDEQAR